MRSQAGRGVEPLAGSIEAGHQRPRNPAVDHGGGLPVRSADGTLQGMLRSRTRGETYSS